MSSMLGFVYVGRYTVAVFRYSLSANIYNIRDINYTAANVLSFPVTLMTFQAMSNVVESGLI